MKLILTFLFLLRIVSTPSLQNKGTIELIIDPEYKGAVEVFDQPNGKIIKAIRQDFKNEDFLFFTLTDETSDFFYGTLEYSISGSQTKGWVKKAKYIGIYARNYDAKGTVKLYSEADSKSKVNTRITNWTNHLIPVVSYKGKWVYARLLFKDKSSEGWLPPNMQCANPYTTCN